MEGIAPRFVTERLVLKEITEKDTDLIVAWRSNPEVYRFFLSPHPLSAGEHMEWFQDQYKKDVNRFDWMAVTKGSKEAVGIFGIKRENGDSKEAEISYLLASKAQGKGYASEAVGCIMRFALERWHCDSCAAKIHVENYASVQFAKRLGFTISGMEGVFACYKRKL